MTVTTQLIGKLGGGGGAPEMQNQQVASTSFVRIPSGWGKAVGVFAGTATAASPTVFGTVFKGMSAGSFLNGGGSSPGRPISIQPPARSRGCAWNRPNGGGH